LSLGMGAMLTFASYLDRTHHLPNESVLIGVSDFGVAFIAGLVVFPVIFAFGMQAMVGGSTVGALFITLPTAFNAMGSAGTVVGALFFAALVVGALTSAISLLEVVVSSAIDILGWPRPKAAIAAGATIAILGIPAALDTDLLGLMDQIAGNVLLVLGGLLLAIFVGWVMEDPIAEVSDGAPNVWWFGIWRVLLRYVVPAVLAFVLLASLRATFETIAGMAD
jgi:NSS family neurotransmitter:Na+ symporter